MITDTERAIARARFAMSIANMCECDAYWCPETRRVTFRRVAPKIVFALPPDSVLIGRYAYPFAARTFLKDLDDVLARLEVGILARLPV